MTVAEMLRARQKELEAQMAAINADLEDIALALAALEGTPAQRPAGTSAGNRGSQSQHPMPVDDAIIIAVQNRCRTPAAILSHLTRELKVHTTINSVRTRVSKLRAEGKLIRTPLGWMLPDHSMKGRSLFGPLPEADD